MDTRMTSLPCAGQGPGPDGVVMGTQRLGACRASWPETTARLAGEYGPQAPQMTDQLPV
jgi:hypothetical protein